MGRFVASHTLCWLLVVAGCGCVRPVVYRIQVQDPTGYPLANAEVSISYTTSIDPSGKTAPNMVTESGTTNGDGLFIYRGLVGISPTVGAGCEGYYRTSNAPLTSSQQTVVLRPMREPVPMYAKSTSIRLPRSEGRFAYDLVVGDLVAPDGRGVTEDVILGIDAGDRIPGRRDVDIEFSRLLDGIQAIFLPERVEPHSDYNFPYLAPEDGYSRTLSQANGDWPENYARWARGERAAELPALWYWTDIELPLMRSWGGEVNYIFRVRCSGVPGCLYGKIYGQVEAVSNPDGIVNVGLTYYLNPDGRRNLEFGENLFEDLLARGDSQPAAR